MSIAAGIVLIVLGAILTFAVKGGHIGDLDLHAVGVILMLAGVIGILLPMLIRNKSRFSRPTIHSRQDVMDDGTRTIVTTPTDRRLSWNMRTARRPSRNTSTPTRPSMMAATHDPGQDRAGSG